MLDKIRIQIFSIFANQKKVSSIAKKNQLHEKNCQHIIHLIRSCHFL